MISESWESGLQKMPCVRRGEDVNDDVKDVLSRLMDAGFDTEALDPADAYQQNWEACGRIGAENLRKNLEKALTCAKKRSSVRMIFELCALFLFTIT